MRFAKLNEAIWTDSRFNSVSTGSKLLYMFLLSYYKNNSVGIYQVGLGAIEDDFKGFDRAGLMSMISELDKVGLLRYEKGWVWFNRYLKWNEPSSPNHARKCASDLNDVVMRNAPIEAVKNFLGSVRPILAGMRYKNTDDHTYYDDFKASLDWPLVGELLGGADVLKSCLTDGKCGLERSTIEGPSDNETSATEVLTKGLGSTETNKNKNKNKNENRREKEEKASFSTSSIGEPSEISLICSDGNSSAVSLSCVLLVRSKLSGLTEDAWRFAINRVQKDTLLHEEKRPDPSQVDDYFVKAMLPVGGLS